MRDASSQLDGLVKEWVQQEHVSEVDWGRMRQLEFQDALRRRDTLANRLPEKVFLQCPHFEAHVRISQI